MQVRSSRESEKNDLHHFMLLPQKTYPHYQTSAATGKPELATFNTNTLSVNIAANFTPPTEANLSFLVRSLV